ncbi:hypothetical protein V9K67_25075 [Paraflavisolibacter sp. H34]|uniref:hypothetical protein n=1 Tax=Huijunlia imazamoxiresistens TaxID=3127457 RepID=UPI0030181B45
MSTLALTINDETGTGKVVHTFQVEFPLSLVTVADIIEKRVRAEVHQHNTARKENFYGLVQPSEAEAALNGSRSQKFRFIDADKQVEAAKEAFLRNGFFLLIDNLQAESLDQAFLLHAGSEISFVKLTPLVGG